MRSEARFIRSWAWFVCCMLGCSSSSDAPQSQQDAAIGRSDAGQPRDAAEGGGGRGEDDAGDARVDADDAADAQVDAGDAPDPCAAVDCSPQADECNTAACNPDTGECELTPRPDGTACGESDESTCTAADSCRAGVCESQHAAAGASCGDSTDSECDHPDTCDGAGACQLNHEASDTVCGASDDTECDNPDRCDGAGSCDGNHEPSGTACGEAATTECDAADSCDGAGACATNLAIAGAACGDGSDAECNDPDTCDGAGVCLVNHADSGAACGDQSVPCHLDDSCDASGACVDAGLLAEGSLCGDDRNDECHNPDVCDAAGSCWPNDEATGSRCGSCPIGIACECRDAVCVDCCAVFGAVDYGYRGCDDSVAEPPCTDISDSGTGLTLAAGASTVVDIGFDFTLYGVARRALHVYEDGVLGFGDGAALPATPECLAAGVPGSAPGPVIAPFWTDFAAGGAIYYQTTGTAPGRTFSVQWTGGHAAAGSSQPADVRVVLSELGHVRVCYVDTTFGSAADSGGLAVAGITDAAGSEALAFSCNEPFLPDTTVIDYYCTDGCPFTTTSDFDDLSDGDRLAATSPEWTSWNGDPAFDSIVVDEPAYSAPNSLQVGANTDLVRSFDAGSGGVVVISAMSYVPTGMTGSMWLIVEDTYYPNGAQGWVNQISLDGTSNTVTDLGGSVAHTGGGQPALVRDTWVEVRVTIDVSARTYSSTYNGQALMTDRAWTLAASGSFHGAVDLYGAADLTPAGYFDDVTIEKSPAAECGDSLVQPGEQCDLGGENSDASGSRCDTTCRYTSLVSWLDGADPNADGSALADGSAVATWVDKARTHDATQLNAAQQPTYAATGLGTGALSFDGLDDFMALPIDINTWLLPSMTIIAVIQNGPGHTSDLAGVWGHDNYGWDRFMVSGGLAGPTGIASNGALLPVAGLTAENVPLITVATLVHGGASSVHINGRQGASFTESHPYTDGGLPTMSIGNLEGPTFPASGSASFDGLIAEVLVFDRALGRAARNQIGSSLAAKYGLASYCGDGVTSDGEQCDDGINDGTECSATCTSVL